MKKKILLTRPPASSKHWGQILTRRGFGYEIDPLLHIEPTGVPRPSGSFQASLFTSAHALSVLKKEDRATFMALPCFCIGEVTGDAARMAGFVDVRCGKSDGGELATLASLALTDKSRPLLHICGDNVDGKIQEILTSCGFVLTAWPVYRAVAADAFKPTTRALLTSGAIACIPVFSPRSAQILVSLIEKNDLVEICPTIAVVALSQAVADVLQTLPWQRLYVAVTPSEESVLFCLEDIYA